MSKKFNYRWLIAAGAMIVALVVAVLINTFKDHNSFDTLVGTIAIDNSDENVNWDRYQTVDVELSDTLTISQSGTYHLTGALENGSIIIDTGVGEVRLILDNVAINNSNGPAIACYSAENFIIELVGENNLSDSATYSSDYDQDVNGAIYSKADLAFKGEGTLNLTANYQDGIVGKDDVKFSSGTYNITAKDDAIRGKDSVYIVAGNFVIESKADAIKSTNEIDTRKGFVLIENGNIAISAGDDGIHAINKLIISGGELNITKSYEGLEAKNIAINGGNVSIIATDDGINAGGGTDTTTTTTTATKNQPGAIDADLNCSLAINGGNVYVNSRGDGLDSNGYLYFNGGTTVVDGPTNNGNGALDSGAGITMNGGTVIAVGASGMAEILGNASSVPNISIYLTSTQPAGTTIEIKDTSDNTVLSHTSAKSFNHIAAGSPDFTFGQTYTIHINGEVYQEFTISDITTTIGNDNNNFKNPPRR